MQQGWMDAQLILSFHSNLYEVTRGFRLSAKEAGLKVHVPTTTYRVLRTFALSTYVDVICIVIRSGCHAFKDLLLPCSCCLFAMGHHKHGVLCLGLGWRRRRGPTEQLPSQTCCKSGSDVHLYAAVLCIHTRGVCSQ